jgi:sugar lactone lactonase YvrE
METQLPKIIGMVFLSGLLVIATGCSKTEQSQPPKEEAATAPAPAPAAAKMVAPDVVTFKKMALYPEGLEYDAKKQRFLVTSLRFGTVGEVSDDGTYQEFIKNDNMVSAIGIRIDNPHDRLLVCNSDPGVGVNTKKETQGKLAGLGIFQLSTGNLIKYIDLGSLSDGGGHFCNDIAVTPDGTAYVTDSFSPIIYKVDINNNASIFLKNDRFNGKGFNLNGVVVTDNYLIVDKDNEGVLFKVPLDNPDNFAEVSVNEKFPGADGMLWGPAGSLIVIANGTTNKMFRLTSGDNWATATVANSIDTGPTFTTTGVVRDGNIYALDARLDVLFNPDTKEQVDTFNIKKRVL